MLTLRILFELSLVFRKCCVCGGWAELTFDLVQELGG